MRILFVHQNFPGQFKHIAFSLAAAGHEVVAMGLGLGTQVASVLYQPYTLFRGNTPGVLPLVIEFESKIIRAEAVAAAAGQLKKNGFVPDVIWAHAGWGESLFLKDVFPSARLLSFLEFYYRFEGGDVNFDPEFADYSLGNAQKVRLKNANNLLALEAMDAGISPTYWQKNQFPAWARPNIHVVHDGIDTDFVKPNADVLLQSQNSQLALRAGDEVVTFVSRNLEPCRGFHVFMRALPEILRQRPKARVLIVGGEEQGYGPLPSSGVSWRQILLNELDGQIDLTRIIFMGRVSYALYLAVLQLSAVHVYLTYPFVLSWSLLEAMSAGCLVVGSKTPPVEEVIEHGKNGLLVDFFDRDALVSCVVNALAHPQCFSAVRQLARQTVIDKYDLNGICLPQHLKLLENL